MDALRDSLPDATLLVWGQSNKRFLIATPNLTLKVIGLLTGAKIYR